MLQSDMDGLAEGDIESGVPITYDDETGSDTFIASAKTVVSDEYKAYANSLLSKNSEKIV